MASFFKKLFGKSGTEYSLKTTITTGEEKKPILEPLNEDEERFIRNNIGLATELFKELDIKSGIHIFDPVNLDIAVEAWFSLDLQSKYKLDEEMYSDCIASAWGNYLSEVLGMEWWVITDDFGTEMGLYHRNTRKKNKNMTIFPFSTVAKAINTKGLDLISMITASTKEVLEE